MSADKMMTVNQWLSAVLLAGSIAMLCTSIYQVSAQPHNSNHTTIYLSEPRTE